MLGAAGAVRGQSQAIAPHRLPRGRAGRPRSRTCSEDEKQYTAPPTTPINAAASGVTSPQPAVMETSPARIPFSTGLSRSTSPRPCRHLCTAYNNMVVRPEKAGARVVLIITSPDWLMSTANVSMSFGAMPSVDPVLKPYQPNHKAMVPRVWNTTE